MQTLRLIKKSCHISGKYRGAAHKSCNLNYQIPKVVAVILHNSGKYDTHLFVKELGNIEGDINCIAETEENYISFSKKIAVDSREGKDGKVYVVYVELRFIDSIQFMKNKLCNLASNLKPEDFVNLSLNYSNSE